MAVFFLLSVAAAWLALFPAARDGVAAGVGRALGRLAWVGGRMQAGAGRRADGITRMLRQRVRGLAGFLHRHRRLAVLALVLLALPPLLVMTVRREVVLEGLDPAVVTAADRHVLDLLRGERLAPPPDLPPAVFTAAEAELQRSAAGAAVPRAIASADRRWDRVDAGLRQQLLAIHQAMARQGYRMVLVEGYRSPGRQAELARRGSGTTLAGAGRSCHQYGLAVDSALYRDGRLQWDMGDPWTRRGYLLYGRLATDAGLEWGGNWRSLKDYVHVEARDACREARRAAGY
ncbi:M15 family metallopeptidase [Lysobacter sp. GX 14042]|uniref:M15 family metallopeptidase n=1 Tax=Lysobacter sp. GX 14042 TaxID=2907155 RepID=UPI001F41CDF1|nr:M15 family metallopeptidase [Lysobacter sp. GX 14042]MCE7032159.1 M15 family metallopeptidase [Lysobacter sp. GX 14042]